MATQTKEIITYSIRIDGHVGWNFGSGARGVDFDHWIYCVAADKKAVKLFFLTNREEPPKSSVDSKGNWYTFFKKDQYVYCLDLLRNEMPIWADLDPDNGRIALRTGSEPIGEGPGEF